MAFSLIARFGMGEPVVITRCEWQLLLGAQIFHPIGEPDMSDARQGTPMSDSMVSVKRRIVGFRQDEQGDWIAQLECGHVQHVRHDPPWTTLSWVTTDEGRTGLPGHQLRCVDCPGIGSEDRS